MQFREGSQIFRCQRTSVFRSKSGRDKKISFLEVILSSESSSGLIEWKIGNPAKIIMPMFLLQVPKKWKKDSLIQKDFFTRRSSGMVECSFDKLQFFFQNVWKRQNGSLIFRKSSEKCSSGQLICRQESAVNIFCHFWNVFGSKYENKRIFFSENLVFLKVFL